MNGCASVVEGRLSPHVSSDSFVVKFLTETIPIPLRETKWCQKSVVRASIELTFRNQRATVQGTILDKVVEYSKQGGEQYNCIPQANKPIQEIRSKKSVYAR